MAQTRLSTSIRKRLYTFARQLASPLSDSRRRRFVHDMITGLVLANHVHLSKIPRAAGNGSENIHSAEKRLCKHLGSEHWDASPLAEELLRQSAARVGEDTLLVADLTDLAKYHAKKLEGLGRVHDGSDPDKRLAPGYVLFEACVRIGIKMWKTPAGPPSIFTHPIPASPPAAPRRVFASPERMKADLELALGAYDYE